MSQFNEPSRPADGPQFQQPQPGRGPQPPYGGQPPQGPPAHAPGPLPQPPKKRRWFLSWPVVAPVAFLLGLLIGTAGEQPAGSAAPAPTVTVTATAENAPPGTASAAPADQPRQQSTTEPHGPDQQPVGSPTIGDTYTTASGNKMTVTAESVVGGEWDDTADDGTYLLVTVKLTNELTEPVQPDMQVAVASGAGGAVAQEGYVDGVNGSWYYETIPAGASRTFAAAFVVSEEQASDLQITLTWSYVESITFTGSAGG